MKTYNCDRCDAKFASEKPLDPPVSKGDTSVDRGATTPAPVVKDGQVTWVKADLCGKCLQFLSEWFNLYKA
jgi:hypothetical protein